MKNEVYERITDRITALLTQGTVPWHKPWKATTSLPRNLVSKKPYRGINAFLLLAMSYESPFWLTFRQAAALGGWVRKGEKACPVVFWKQLKIEDKEADKTRRIPLLRYYHVFNAAQCDGLKVNAVAEPMGNGGTKPEVIVANMPQPPVVKHGMTRASYSLSGAHSHRVSRAHCFRVSAARRVACECSPSRKANGPEEEAPWLNQTLRSLAGFFF
jgi:antirestriction protein ArdC